MKSFRLLTASLLLGAALPVLAEGGRVYEVEITNITKGLVITPALVATHTGTVRLFDLGGEASPELEELAEGGATGPLADLLLDQGAAVGEVKTAGPDEVIPPGKTLTLEVRGRGPHRYFSVAAMLVPTNDTFMAVNGARLPRHGSRTVLSPGYDAGTEENDQNCATMPGPGCGGAGHSPDPADGDEGFIYIGNGFHDLGEFDAAGNRILGPLTYDWRNPVARVKVRRVR